jgi:O-6-methylguanine DNA methyltransferase
MKVISIDTAYGTFSASFTQTGLAHLAFPNEQALGQTAAVLQPVLPASWREITGRALSIALQGFQPKELPPLDLSAGTEFQRAVWKVLARIPCGQTLTYADVALAVGRLKAVRAVGQACGKNPVPIFVPCHRVLAARGRLGGFSGGLEWKTRLLALEGSRWTK